jgi:hypothetical protein
MNINTVMENTLDLEHTQKNQANVGADQLPNESGSFCIDGVVKIFDPNTQEILVESRA